MALSADLQWQRDSTEYSSTFVASTTSLASCSTIPKSEAPHTPYRNVHLDPPSRRPDSFITAEGYIIEEFPRSRCVSEPSRPKHRRFHSTPNVSSPAQVNHSRARKHRRSTMSNGYSARRSSPLSFPPSLPVPPVPPIPHVPVSYREDLTPSPDPAGLLPLEPSPVSSAPIWPESSPRRNKPVTQSMKLKKRRPRRKIEYTPERPSFGEWLRSLFTSKSKRKRQEGIPTPNTLLINRHFTAKFIPPPPAGIRFSELVIS